MQQEENQSKVESVKNSADWAEMGEKLGEQSAVSDPTMTTEILKQMKQLSDVSVLNAEQIYRTQARIALLEEAIDHYDIKIRNNYKTNPWMVK